MNKRTLRIIIFSFVIAIIILGIWFFIFIRQESEPEPTNNGGSTTQNFFPVTTTFTPEDTTTEDNSEIVENNFIPTLRQLSRDPVAGIVAFERELEEPVGVDPLTGSTSTPEETTETIFRYIDVGMGHIYETSERNTEQERISNVTIPKIKEAFFSNEGDQVVMRFLAPDNETIETTFGTLVENTSTTTEDKYSFEVAYWPQNIDSISTNGSEITYSIEEVDTTTIYSLSFANPVPSAVYGSDVSNILVQKPSANISTFTTKADSRVPGHSFFVTSNGQIENVVSAVLGLTTNTSPDSSKMIFSDGTNTNISTFIMDTSDKIYEIFRLNTLAEKCVWSRENSNLVYCAAPKTLPSASYPEDWYQGLVSFNDAIYEIDLEADTYSIIIDPQTETNQIFDIINPTLSPNDEYLMFINKRDLTPWTLDLQSI